MHPQVDFYNVGGADLNVLKHRQNWQQLKFLRVGLGSPSLGYNAIAVYKGKATSHVLSQHVTSPSRNFSLMTSRARTTRQTSIGSNRCNEPQTDHLKPIRNLRIDLDGHNVDCLRQQDPKQRPAASDPNAPHTLLESLTQKVQHQIWTRPGMS